MALKTWLTRIKNLERSRKPWVITALLIVCAGVFWLSSSWINNQVKEMKADIAKQSQVYDGLSRKLGELRSGGSVPLLRVSPERWLAQLKSQIAPEWRVDTDISKHAQLTVISVGLTWAAPRPLSYQDLQGLKFNLVNPQPIVQQVTLTSSQQSIQLLLVGAVEGS